MERSVEFSRRGLSQRDRHHAHFHHPGLQQLGQRDFPQLRGPEPYLRADQHRQAHPDPADDPVGSVRLLRLDQEQGLNEQYKTGMTEAKNSLSQEETILRSVGNVLQRIHGSPARPATAHWTQRQEVAGQRVAPARGRVAEPAQAAPRREWQTYFPGPRLGAAVRAQRGRHLSYMGDESQRRCRSPAARGFRVSDSGKVLFEDIVKPLVSIPRRRLATPATVASRSAWSRTSWPSTASSRRAIRLRQPTASTSTSSATRSMWSTIRRACLRASDWTTHDPNSPPAWQLSKGAIDDDPKTIDKVLYAGVSVTIDGTPKAGDEFNVN
ncbi:hypothetical protein ACPA9J_12505 [Pseudomonas aeruginosa]